MIPRPLFFLFLAGSLGLIHCTSDSSVSNEGKSEESISFPGKVNWIQTFGGSLNDEVKAITPTADGGYVLLGNTESIDGDVANHTTATQDFWIIRLDNTGELLWNKTYGGDNDDRGQAIHTTSDGGFLVSGYSRSATGDVSTNKGSYDHWIIRLDAEGILRWEKSFGYLGDDRAFAVLQTQDQGFLTAGFLDVETYTGPNASKNNAAQKTSGTQHGVGEFWVHKLAPDGSLEWEQYYGGSSNDRAYDALQTDDGNYLLVGATESTDFDISKNNGSYDFWVIKIDQTGTLLWEKTFGGSASDSAHAIARTQDDHYIIAGDTRSADGTVSNGLGNADAWIIKIDTNGNLIWEQTYGGSAYDAARAIFATKDGGYVISGSTSRADGDISTHLGNNDLWVFKIANEGQFLGGATFGGSQFDFGYGVVQDAQGDIIVVGNTQSPDIPETEFYGGVDALVISIQSK